MKWTWPLPLLLIAACAPEPDPTAQARDLAVSHFGPEAEISSLTPTMDGRALCGMAFWRPSADLSTMPAYFMVENGRVIRLRRDVSLYRRCGDAFVEPSSIPPVE